MISSGKISLDGEDLLELEAWERARKGVFLFPIPQAVPGSASRALPEKVRRLDKRGGLAKGPCSERLSSRLWKRSLSPDHFCQGT